MRYFSLLFFLLFSWAITFSQVNLNTGLLAYYPFNGNANDASGNNLNLTGFNGVQLTTDRFGNSNSAYHFDGLDDYMKVADNGLLSTASFSICYYVNTESTTYQNCIGKINYVNGQGATYNSGIFQPGSTGYFATISDQSGCNIQVPGTLVYTMYNGIIQPNQWHCIVNTFENGVQKLYIDGVMTQTTVPFNQSKFCTNTDFVIGSWWQSDPYRFKGKMDEIRFYNRAINQDEVNALCVLESCNNWLSTPSYQSYISVGDLDIPGNQLTIEAEINRTQPYSPGTGNNSDGDIVSKHVGPESTNYLLRPNHAYITTSDGFFATPDACSEIELNKTYHLAMVYDGNTLKYYRNGYLLSQVPATGSLVQNNYDTRIGLYTDVTIENFLGYINEVRIWNIARTQDQIRANMNSSLSNPTTQPGLQAYYTFDDLLNKQGNAAWNATIGGSAAINTTNPNCSFIADSCNLILPASCSGSLGEPIVNITFGQGSNPGPTLAAAVPGASTSYSYVAPVGSPASNIVLDGNYAIINSIPANPYWHLGGGDHTNNGNGYMAFFNAAPDPGEFYTQTVNNLCAGTTYEFAAWILNAVNSDLLPSAVPPNVTFKIFNPANLVTPIASFSTGDIVSTNFPNWQRFSTLFTLPAGLNSVVLTLSNNNVGGTSLIGNDLAIDDITFSACGPLTSSSFASASSVTAITLCNGQPYTIYGTVGSGLNTPVYQWQVSTDNGSNWTNVPAGTSLNYSFPTGSLAGHYLYRLVSQESANVGSLYCKFYSNIIDLTVNPCNAQSISDIINNYTPVLALNPCNNSITVEDGTAFNSGDTVLLIQMKGADIDESNSATFGTITNYHNAGNYEFNIVKARTGNIIELKNKLTRQYDIPLGKVQLIRVPYYTSVNVASTLTCLPWDGNKGGVLVLHARDTVNLSAELNVNGKGFAGALGFNSNNAVLTCFENQYTYPAANAVEAALKGESITTLPNNIVRGKGAPASGGGGGLGHNSGGGGGGNAGAGGFGGYQLDNCGSFPFDNRGIGGHALTYSTAANKIFLGAGGGAGNEDNPGNVPPDGGNGAGIIIVIADYLKANNNKIKANGDSGLACQIFTPGNCHDGMAGGGGGGSVLLDVNQYLGNVTVEKKGGDGADMIADIFPGGRIGPGGGGGGGMLFIKNASLPGFINSINTGGAGGVLTDDSNNPYGATGGTDGLNLFNLVIPIDTVLFKPNIDSVRIQETGTSCLSFNFHGLGYTNTTGITSWHWNFGDNTTADVQDILHTYPGNGSYEVHLVVSDINGCKDSLIKNITISCPNLITNVINAYTPVLSLNTCDNSLTLENAAAFNTGDTVLLIQMKGAVADSSNTNLFGTVTNYRNAGNYEFNYILSKTGNVVKFKNKLTRQYDIPDGKVQLIRVPYYTSVTVSGNLSCLPWDGAKGGVLAFNVRDTLTFSGDIDVSAKGFRGGAAGNSFLCGVADYATSFGTTGSKGEGIAELNAPWDAGGGHLANGGGGSFGGNSGAGGGSNLVAGGLGGKEYSLCPGLQSIQGQALTNNLNKKIYMGGGGGGGQFDNGFVVYPGGNGAGIVFISSNHVKGNSFNINANGFSRSEVINDEGGAAGGAGGSVILAANNFINTINVNATGGSGNSNNNSTFPNDCHGPGAGGSGGVVFVKQGSLPANLTATLTGGAAGLVLNPASICFNTTHGATNGLTGNPLFNFVMNIDTVLFVPNIDSVRIQSTAISCTGFNFHATGYTNTSPIVSWNWNFGDGNYGTGADTTHTYSGTGPYTAHLVGTDVNGCKDSITIPVNLNALTVNAGLDTAICTNGVVTHVLHGNTTGTGYTWTPAVLLDNNSIPNPTATISATTMFYLNTSGVGGCNAIDSVLVTINPLPALTSINDFAICKLDSILLTTVSTATTFQWTPPLSVNNPSVSSPYFTDTVSQQLIVTGTNPLTGCFIKDTVNATIKPLPDLLTAPDTSLCGPHAVSLTASGAQTYSWAPATGLSNPTIANPVFNGTTTQTYIITGTGINACVAKDTITITVNAQPSINTIANNAICQGDSIQLTTITDAQTIQWSPSGSVSNPTTANPYFHDIITQQMIVTGTNATGCFVKDTVTITVKPVPDVQTIADTALCGPHSVICNTTGAQSYSWLPATGLSNPSAANPVFSGTSTQTYTVTGTASNGCTAKDTLSITVNTVPLVNAAGPFTICRNDLLQLTASSNAQVTHWSPPLSVNNPDISSPYFTDSLSQQMIVTGTNTSTGCFASDTVAVTVKPLPAVRTIRDTVTCTTNSITLFTSGAQTYSWSPAAGLDNPNSQNPIFTGSGVNTYYVTGTGANGCIAKDTVTVNITSKPAFNAPENKEICVNESVQLDGNNGSSYQYTWSPGTDLSNTSIPNPVASPTSTIIYSLLIHDQVCNYDSSFTLRVIVHPLPVVTAGKLNDMDCNTPQSQLTANGALHYEWIPATYLTDASISNPVASPYITTHYIVAGTDLNGCVDTDTVTVIVKGSKYFGFAIPNAFTPNRDNLNDCFGVTYWGETKNFHLMVYNRWGEKVFETRNVSECWDGTYKGNPAEIGNYVYYLTGETLCGKVTRKGNLVLFR